MADKAKLPAFDFYTISAEDISEFLKTNASDAELEDFFKHAYVKKQETVMVPDVIITEDGRTIQKMTKQKKTDKATGKSVVVLDENGKPVMVPKKKAVPVKGGAIIEKYSHREAVKWFIETYVDITPPKAIMNNRPVEAKEKKKSANDVFESLRKKINA